MGKNLVRDNYYLALQYDADLVKFSHRDSNKIGEDFSSGFMQRSSCKVMKGKEIQENYAKLIGDGYLVLVWDKLFKKSFLEKNKVQFDETFYYGNDDVDFCMKLFPCLSSLVISDRIYYLHILHKGSTSGKFSDEKINGTLELMRREKKMLLSLKIDLYKNEFWNQRIEQYLLLLVVKFKNKCSQRERGDIESIFRELRNESYYMPSVYNKEKVLNKQKLYVFLFRNNYIKAMVFLIILSRKFNKIFDR